MPPNVSWNITCSQGRLRAYIFEYRMLEPARKDYDRDQGQYEKLCLNARMSEKPNAYIQSQILIYEAMIAEIMRFHPRIVDMEYAIRPEVSEDWHRLLSLQASLKTLREFQR